jgi:hypothetical protein
VHAQSLMHATGISGEGTFAPVRVQSAVRCLLLDWCGLLWCFNACLSMPQVNAAYAEGHGSNAMRGAGSELAGVWGLDLAVASSAYVRLVQRKWLWAERLMVQVWAVCTHC